MPTWLSQLASVVIAVFLLLLVVTGITSLLLKSVRDLVFRRIGGSIYRLARQDALVEDQRTAQRQEDARKLRDELGRLSDAAFEGHGAFLNQAAAKVRLYCPEAGPSLDTLVNYTHLGSWATDTNKLHELLSLVMEAARPRLDP